MKSRYYILLFTLSLVFFSCSKTPSVITKTSDYNTYLELVENETLQSIKGDYVFWEEKLEKEPSQYPYLVKLAASQSQLFSTTGNISFLISAEKNLIRANDKIDYSNCGYLRALARNYISQHRFKESLSLLQKAEAIGDNLKDTQKMLFDVHLELGHIEEAEIYLSLIKDLTDFDFLIRLAKWSDHQGELDATLKYMEKAMKIAESSKRKNLMEWSYTNIADYYGHDGQIKKSYEYYLKALKLNPGNAYAKKGLAWIIYSYERNPKEALRILDSISKQHQAPDYYLFKAEIAEYMKDYKAKNMYIKRYVELVKNKNYGMMYMAYNAKLFAEDLNKTDEALNFAQLEIKNRPTAESYGLLAWTYYNKGEVEKALQVAEKHVINHTYEPEALFHLAKIYKANGKTDEALLLKKELLKSGFELGPILENEVINI
ncbi:tetratricopeptide repeat protein [Lacinutrix iliipiscaria]|uniref:Tetratricopeptide repeat protein n=1 Tax=Lacinutrix iliipiscaria TaxID=1230532 RepID=A0ABW5WP02_9FLAO